jgi:hypothetical protein
VTQIDTQRDGPDSAVRACPPWTDEMQARAMAEGWWLSWCVGQAEELQLQRLDDPDVSPVRWDDDTEVWEYVWALAYVGSPLHAAALATVRVEDPVEWANIVRHVTCQVCGARPAGRDHVHPVRLVS